MGVGPAESDLDDVVQGQQRPEQPHVESTRQPGVRFSAAQILSRATGWVITGRIVGVWCRMLVVRRSRRRQKVGLWRAGPFVVTVGFSVRMRDWGGRCGTDEHAASGSARRPRRICSLRRRFLLRLDLSVGRPVLAHFLGNRPALLLGHRAFPRAGSRGPLLAAAPGGGGDVSLDSVYGLLYWVFR